MPAREARDQETFHRMAKAIRPIRLCLVLLGGDFAAGQFPWPHCCCWYADEPFDTRDNLGDEWEAPAAHSVAESDVQQAMAYAEKVMDLAGIVSLCSLGAGVQPVHHALTSHVTAGHESSPEGTIASKAVARLGNKRLSGQGIDAPHSCIS